MSRTCNAAAALFLACIVFAAACRSALPSPPSGSEPQTLKLTLEKVLVDRVLLTVPRATRDASGATREITEAHLVRLKIDHPPPMAERIVFFVGDYEVPEYGGWPHGIYFKIHDPELLRRLDGQEFAYSFLDEGRRDLGARLEIPPAESLKLKPEREVIRSSD